MSIDPSAATPPQPPPAGDQVAAGVDHCIVKRRDGIYADPTVLSTTFAAAIDGIFSNNNYFVALDYAVVLKIIYGIGPALPRSAPGEVMVRFASDIHLFDPRRRLLYKKIKIVNGQAEYYFEPVVLTDPADPDGPGLPAHLNTDEFIADMWTKGVRFGIDVASVQRAIELGKAERVFVASRLDPVPGIDAHIIEVSSDLHRSDAPRQLANGKLDLMAFQNRFPQIKKGERLLKKVPRKDGETGFELSGAAIAPPIPKDVELTKMSGAGTAVDITGEGEFLVSTQAGFLNVDSKTSELSVGDKIVSRDGVSARTTGNLQLTGDYEEFGEVQEKRVIEGEGITIHADVFGNIVSRGGTILLNNNLVGGSAHNARGDIRVKGVASGAVLQTSQGEVHIQRAENCIVSGTRVIIEQALNCDIMAEEIVIGQAEGCAVAARKVSIEAAGPRKQAEMQIFAFTPDSARIDEAIAAMRAKAVAFGDRVSERKAELEALTNAPEVRKYVMLASKIRKKELTLTAEQLPQFQKMAAAVGPSLKAIAKVSLEVNAAETEQTAATELVAELQRQRIDNASASSVQVARLTGETTLRSLTFNLDGASLYDFPAKDITPRLRSNSNGADLIQFADAGAIDWRSE